MTRVSYKVERQKDLKGPFCSMKDFHCFQLQLVRGDTTMAGMLSRNNVRTSILVVEDTDEDLYIRRRAQAERFVSIMFIGSV